MSKQIEFPEMQTHNKSFELAMLALSVLCIVFVVIMIVAVGGGNWDNF